MWSIIIVLTVWYETISIERFVKIPCGFIIAFHLLIIFAILHSNCFNQNRIIEIGSKSTSNIFYIKAFFHLIPILRFDHGRLQPIFSTIQPYCTCSRFIELDVSHCLFFLLRRTIFESSTFLYDILQNKYK